MTQLYKSSTKRKLNNNYLQYTSTRKRPQLHIHRSIAYHRDCMQKCMYHRDCACHGEYVQWIALYVLVSSPRLLQTTSVTCQDIRTFALISNYYLIITVYGQASWWMHELISYSILISWPAKLFNRSVLDFELYAWIRYNTESIKRTRLHQIHREIHA